LAAAAAPAAMTGGVLAPVGIAAAVEKGANSEDF
jgi:hypothetical protein